MPANTAPTLLAGRYRLKRRIATGGMGVVWEATDELLDRPVAIKVVKPEYADDPVSRQRLQAEARAAAAVHDPHVVAIYDVGESVDGDHVDSFIVMPLLTGRSLAAELATGPLPPQRVARLLADVSRALAAAHERGVVHRDIKPANLMIEPDGRFVVLDFGIARAASAAALTATGVVLGTARYLSPEQARGQAATAASDVYSLGVVGYEALTGSPPFTGDSDVATALAHVNASPPPLPATVPQPLAKLVMACLAKDPGDRPNAADVAAAAADLTLPPDRPPVPPTTPLPAAEARASALPRWLSSRWLLGGAAAALALIALITSLALAGGGSSQPQPASTTSQSSSTNRHPARWVRVVASRYVGQPWTEVASRLRAHHLKPVERLTSAAAPAGTVIALDPVGKVRRGHTIVVTVATNPAPPAAKHPPGHGPKPVPPGHRKEGD